jgi:hypothetical protein
MVVLPELYYDDIYQQVLKVFVDEILKQNYGK